MAEPQLERFLNRLADSRFDVSLKQYDDLVTDLISYLDKTRAQTVAKTIGTRDEKTRNIIISNVARLYPLSASLLEALLKECRQTDGIFAQSFETCSDVLKELSACLERIERSSASWTTSAFQKLQSDIGKLNSRVEKLRAPVGEYGELLKKKQELEERLAADSQAAEEKRLKQENESLENELKHRQSRIATLEEQLEKKKKEKENYDDNIASLLGQLQELESFASEEQKNAWIRLVKDFPEDAHEERK